MIGRFPSFFVSVFQGPLLVMEIMIDGNKEGNCEGQLLNFRVRVFVKRAISSLSLPTTGNIEKRDPHFIILDLVVSATRT